MEEAVLDVILNSEWEDLLNLEFLMDSYRDSDQYQDELLRIVVQCFSEYPYSGRAFLQFPQIFCKFPQLFVQALKKVTEFEIGEFVQASPDNS